MSTDEALLPVLPFLKNDDSMLTRRFGKEVVNYYAGGTLNRISFLRPDTKFLAKAATSPNTKYLALRDLNPLVKDKNQLAYLQFDDVKSLIGSEPFALSEEDFIKQFDSTLTTPTLVFLGLLDDTAEEGQQIKFESAKHGEVGGQPFFALDVTPKGSFADAANASIKKWEDQGLQFHKDPRSFSLPAESAAMYGQARSMLDWNARNTFCGGCGLPNLSVHAGYKRVCPPADRKGHPSESQTRPDCHTRHGVSNLCFPRTDPTMIAAVVSADGQRVLLGRQSRWPPNWYSTLAGFLEPGEAIEEAVRREVWEESGVKVGRVVIHSSQPWPYPSSLMIGAIAQALPTADAETITLNDKELEAARWFELDEIREALKNGVAGLGQPPKEGYVEGNLRLPPPQAIANRLITAVAEGFLVNGAPKI